MKLSGEQQSVINAFATANGRTWRAILKRAWITGIYPQSVTSDDRSTLQRIRNTAGIESLKNIKAN